MDTTHANFWLWLSDHLLQAGMNVRYHQTMVERMGRYELVANIAVAACIVISIVVAASVKSKKSAIGWAGSIGFIGLVILFLPFPRWSSTYQDFHRQWSTIQAQLTDMRWAFLSARDQKELPACLEDQKRAIDNKIGSLQAEEPKPDDALLRQCWGDQLERTYGHGLRTTRDVAEYFKAEGIKPPVSHIQPPADPQLPPPSPNSVKPKQPQTS